MTHCIRANNPPWASYGVDRAQENNLNLRQKVSDKKFEYQDYKSLRQKFELKVETIEGF